MLEARIHQLQSDDVLHVQHAKVQIVKAQSSGRCAGKGPKSIPQEKTDIPKSGQIAVKGASKSQPTRWMKKLTEEKKKKLKRQQHLQQKLHTDVQEKPSAKSISSKSSSHLPGTSQKTISTVPLSKRRSRVTLSDETNPAIPSVISSTAATATAETAATKPKGSKGKQKHSKHQLPGERAVSDGHSRAKELAEVEGLERRLSVQVGQCTSSSDPERTQNDREGIASGETHQIIRCYLEACVFIGDIQRAHRFLLRQHRVMSRRKHLNTDVYNIMMRVWAKKVSSTSRIKISPYVSLSH